MPLPINATLAKKPLDPVRKAVKILRLAFPNDQNAPAHVPQRRFVFPVAERVGVQLVTPESTTLRRFRDAVPRTSLVSVPETPVYEDHLPASAEYEVGASRQVLRVEAVAVPQAMDQPPNPEFGLGARGPDPTHPLASLASRQRVEATSFHAES